MQIKVKICGLTRRDEVDAAVQGGASHVGFIFTRHPTAISVSLAQAAILAARVPSHVRKVGVFFEQDSVLFLKAIAYAELHVLQLHATDPLQASNERLMTGRSVWGVAPIRSVEDLRNAGRWRGMVDRLLYDIKGDFRPLAGAKHPLP